MTTILIFTSVLIISLWLILRAADYFQNKALNASLLAELEEMDASLNSLEAQDIENDRFMREFDIGLETIRAANPQSNTQPSPSLPANQHGDSTFSSADLAETPPRKPARRRLPVSTPKTLEEYEATRKPLPPAPVRIPSANASSLFDQRLASSRPHTPSDIRVNPGPLVVQDLPRTKKSLLGLCTAPIRVIARCFGAALTPILRISKIFANFFARPKPPAIPDERQAIRRAA